MGEVEQVATLVALEKRPQFRSKHLLPREGRYIDCSRKPRVFDAKVYGARRIERRDFSRVDFDLEADRGRRCLVLRVDTESQLRGDRALVELRAPQPWFQHPTDAVENRAHRTVRGADKADPYVTVSRHTALLVPSAGK